MFNVYTKPSGLSVQANSFSRIGVEVWNGIPQALRNLSEYAFKRKLKQILFNINPFICSSFSWLKNLWRKKCSRSKVGASGEISFNVEDYLETERCKEELGDFTLSEYNEKGTSCVVCSESHDLRDHDQSAGNQQFGQVHTGDITT